MSASPTNHLDVARNPLRSSFDRLDAWNSFEALKWATAHIERDFPMSALPKRYDYCFGIGDRIGAIIKAHIGSRIPAKVSA